MLLIQHTLRIVCSCSIFSQQLLLRMQNAAPGTSRVSMYPWWINQNKKKLREIEYAKSRGLSILSKQNSMELKGDHLIVSVLIVTLCIAVISRWIFILQWLGERKACWRIYCVGSQPHIIRTKRIFLVFLSRKPSLVSCHKNPSVFSLYNEEWR